MSHQWNKTIQISGNLIKKLLKDQFNITVTKIKLLGEGFDNCAFFINKTWVFRFPRRESGILCLNNEIAILPDLARKLSFSFSYPTLIGTPSSDFPFPFAGYPFLAGRPLSEAVPPSKNQVFARSLGLWLKELHSLPVDKNHYHILDGDQTWRLDINNREESIVKNLEKYKDIYQQENFSPNDILNTFNIFKKNPFVNNNSCYLHGDLYAKHLLIDDSEQLVGLIDWGDTHIGHPAIDLSVGLMVFSDEAGADFFKAYGGVDNNMLKIATFRAFCHAVTALPYFVLIKEETTIAWTKAALRNTLKKSQEYQLL